MQQRGVNTGMDVDAEGRITPPQSRGRNNSKLKVLVRSHAMREEASPPREPTPTAAAPCGAGSPCIKLTPSDDATTSPTNRPLLVLSPSSSPPPTLRSPNLSPTTTLVPSSPTTLYAHHQSEFSASSDADSPKNVGRLNRQNLYNCKRVIVEEATANNRKPAPQKCECHNCARNQERNYNNNLSSANNNNNNTNALLTVGRANTRGKLRQQSSSQGSFEGSSSNSPCLSRDNSAEQYTDTTGVDLELFIPETLNRNAKDRALMLRIEEELVQLAKDKLKTHFKFPPMSSYQRMLVHRCAAYFGMDHNIESSGKCVVVNKTKNTRIPDVEFKQHVKEDIVFGEEPPRRSILKRDSNSVEDYGFKSPDRQCSLESRRSKSFEEREEEYEKARRRIFNKEMHDCGSGDDLGWSDIAWASPETENLSRYRLHTSDHHHGGRMTGRLLKVQSEETGEETLRPCVAKSYSFGGYGGVLTRGDSMLSTHSAGPRLLTKQDSGASSVSWRLSPSSSGYKTQSQRSESVTPSPTSTPYLSGDSARQDSTNSTATNVSDLNQDDGDGAQLVWAVTNINNVPKGSVIINPQTGQPMKNQDGSLYRYDPNNPLPPELQPTSSKPPQPPPSPIKSPQKTTTARERPASPKKRTRSSPVKKTNSSTSPSLPFTPPPPPPQQSRSFSFAANNGEQTGGGPQSFSMYAPSYTPENQVPVYQPPPPCIVFAPYNTHVPVSPYDGRMEPQVQEVSGYFNISEAVPNPAPAQPITYQTAGPPVWNQPVAYYQNPQPPTNRYAAVPHPAYVAQYVPQQPQNPEMIPVYPQQQQSVPVLYPSQPSQSNALVYPNQNIVYAPNPPAPPQPVFSAYPQNISYPVNASTPNSCSSSISTTPYQVFDHQQQQHLVQNVAHMTISGGGGGGRVLTPKGKPVKGTYSSQSSTETSSPAMTVVAGYCHNGQGLYRQTPETPPATHAAPPSFAGNFVSPMFFRQMGNVRASPPITSRSSRSPTPASETHVDRQRYSLPPLVYQGMPYPIQSDTRIVPGRGQPTAYRQAPIRQQQNPAQGPAVSVAAANDNKNFKNRRSRGNRSSLPPNGKQPPHI